MSVEGTVSHKTSGLRCTHPTLSYFSTTTPPPTFAPVFAQIRNTLFRKSRGAYSHTFSTYPFVSALRNMEDFDPLQLLRSTVGGESASKTTASDGGNNLPSKTTDEEVVGDAVNLALTMDVGKVPNPKQFSTGKEGGPGTRVVDGNSKPAYSVNELLMMYMELSKGPPAVLDPFYSENEYWFRLLSKTHSSVILTFDVVGKDISKLRRFFVLKPKSVAQVL
ncbi:hypothetical protein PIB30_066349 [Stylosanthes scabra]|uniref:Uncharacterized protein n=1 Tax=Stylosanthes scabra TaxID=79078 RepID=A0ABU6UM96_9FABA|nr:hypothetical protein [Stylosanthes scabra]